MITVKAERDLEMGTESYAESLTFFPELGEFATGPDEYLKLIQSAKRAVSIPIIGSLNGVTNSGWTKYAKYIEEAGADALELNVYFLPTDVNQTGEEIETTCLDILKSVKSSVSIPVAFKMNPFFSSIANMAKRLDDAGADGLVLFNRFYQPDIDLENLEITPNVLLSTPQAMRLPLRWVAILYGRVQASLAGTSGIHTGEDALKVLMAGANVTMLCSVLMKDGIRAFRTVLDGMERWMEEHEYESVQQMIGSLSHKNCEDPSAFERANYMKALRQFM